MMQRIRSAERAAEKAEITSDVSGGLALSWC
jgi:hypothetical protein